MLAVDFIGALAVALPALATLEAVLLDVAETCRLGAAAGHRTQLAVLLQATPFAVVSRTTKGNALQSLEVSKQLQPGVTVAQLDDGGPQARSARVYTLSQFNSARPSVSMRRTSFKASKRSAPLAVQARVNWPKPAPSSRLVFRRAEGLQQKRCVRLGQVSCSTRAPR